MTGRSDTIGGSFPLASMAMPAGIIALVAMMVLPLPVAFLDTFFVCNILLSLLILMAALQSYRPLDFSSFPSMLLFATVLRLSLNVASARIVLTHGHMGEGAAGHVIKAFGKFVIGGNFVVGIVVFAILTIINLVVITKGAGRVSEVTARFTLDAMPGKQMAIDADLNAGLMTADEARTRRAEVADEADFYGGMDGASKFVKGDAVAGILILAINILGGIGIGVMQHGMSLSMAAHDYVLLAIGDGLVAQVPSLLLSIATAVIVTRVSASQDMASHIAAQLGLARAWGPVAAVLAAIGLVPGMPNLLFLTAAAGAGAIAWVTSRPKPEVAEAEDVTEEVPGPAEGVTLAEVADYAQITVQIGYGLICLVDRGAGMVEGAPSTSTLVARITAIRRDVSRALGFVVPAARIRDDLDLPPNGYRVRIGQTIVGEDAIYPDRKLALPGAMSVRKLGGIEVKDPSFGSDAVWIQPHQQAEAEADDHVVVEPDSVLATHLSQILFRHAASLLGPDEVQALLDQLGQVAPTLVQTVVPKLVPLHTLTSVLRALLAERVPISDMRRILEDLSLLSGRNIGVLEIAEALRPGLIPLVLQEVAPLGQPLPVITLQPELEQMLLRSLKGGPDAALAVDSTLATNLVSNLTRVVEQLSRDGRQGVIVVANPLRRPFATFLKPYQAEAIVLAVGELPEDRRVEVVAVLGGPEQAALPQGVTNG